MVTNRRNCGLDFDLDLDRHWVPFALDGYRTEPDEVMIATHLPRGITPDGVIHTITPDRNLDDSLRNIDKLVSFPAL